MNVLGDFQTPPALAARVLEALGVRGIRPGRILEPTCGSGAFLAAAAHAFPNAHVVGIEYQRARYTAALNELQLQFPQVTVDYANAYELNFARLKWRARGPLLVVGNPPWITAAALGRGPADTLQPPRSNPKRLRGLAARTGAANFDVAEFLMLKLLGDLRGEPLHLALLVKESVARNVVRASSALDLGVASAEIVRIDARRWFGVAVDACCLLLSTARDGGLAGPIAIRADFGGAPVGWCAPAAPPGPAGAAGEILFRQGIKHDAADVFELRLVDGTWRNGYGDAVDVEPDFRYPLLKARALHAGLLAEPTALIVPQLRLGAPTAELENQAPRLWRYLQTHAARIAARKSSIYRNAPPFAMFGIGAYSFAPWKLAVAGLYAQPRFRVIGPQAGRPIVLGDTSYFVPFEREADARAVAARCAAPDLVTALAQCVVPGKRPITKALLDALVAPVLSAAANC